MVGALGIAAAVGLGVVSVVGASPAARAAPAKSATLTCQEAIRGAADPDWRKHSTVAGPFGFYGPGRNFRKKATKNGKGFYVSKVPSILEGSSAVTVTIAPRDADRAGLSFGTEGGDTVPSSFAEVRYEPCLDRSPTGWPGGFVLADRHPVKLFVRVAGGSSSKRVFVGKPKRR